MSADFRYPVNGVWHYFVPGASERRRLSYSFGGGVFRAVSVRGCAQFLAYDTCFMVVLSSMELLVCSFGPLGMFDCMAHDVRCSACDSLPRWVFWVFLYVFSAFRQGVPCAEVDLLLMRSQGSRYPPTQKPVSPWPLSCGGVGSSAF